MTVIRKREKSSVLLSHTRPTFSSRATHRKPTWYEEIAVALPALRAPPKDEFSLHTVKTGAIKSFLLTIRWSIMNRPHDKPREKTVDKGTTQASISVEVGLGLRARGSEKKGVGAPEGFGTKRRRPTPRDRFCSIWAAAALLMLLYSRLFSCRTASLLAAAHTGFLSPGDPSSSRDPPSPDGETGVRAGACTCSWGKVVAARGGETGGKGKGRRKRRGGRVSVRDAIDIEEPFWKRVLRVKRSLDEGNRWMGQGGMCYDSCPCRGLVYIPVYNMI